MAIRGTFSEPGDRPIGAYLGVDAYWAGTTCDGTTCDGIVPATEWYTAR